MTKKLKTPIPPEIKAAMIYPRRGGDRGRAIILPPDIAAGVVEIVKSVTNPHAEKRRKESYALNDIRAFIAKRSWFLVGTGPDYLVSPDEYEMLKARTLVIPARRVDYLRAFMDGFLRAKR